MGNQIQEAIATIGSDDPSADWKLDPGSHIKSFKDIEKAGPLIRVLQSDDVSNIVSRFKYADLNAIKAQAGYKRFGRLGIFATLSATLIGALFLLPLNEWFGAPWSQSEEIRFVAILFQYISISLAFMAYRILSWRNYYVNWQSNRGSAEIARIELFDHVMQKQEQVLNGELSLLPLKLEYFRRFQLDMQKRFYGKRGAEHRSGASRSKSWRLFSWLIYSSAAIIAVPALIFVVSDFTSISFQMLDRLKEFETVKSIAQVADQSLLAVGIMTSAIHATAVARSRMDLDERNAARYRVTSKNLEFLSDAELRLAREKAESDDLAGVLTFVSQVQRQISSEHQEWVLLAEISSDAQVALI